MSSFRGFFKQSVLYSIAGLSRQAVGIILVPIYTRVFSPSEFGTVDMITTITSFLSMFLTMGVDSAMAKHYCDAGDDAERKEIVSTTVLYLLGTTLLVIMTALMFVRPLAGILLGGTDLRPHLAVTLVTMPFTIVVLHFKNLLKWQNRAQAQVWYGLSLLLLQTGLTIVLVVLLRMGVMGILVAALASSVLFAGIGYWLTWSSHAAMFSWGRLRALLQFGVPLAPVGLANYVLTYSDRYFLQHMLGMEAVGLYGLSYKISSFLSLLFMGLQVAIGPFVLSNYRKPEAPVLFARLFDYVSVAYCLAVLGVSLFAPEVVALFATETYYEAFWYVPLLGASSLVYTLGTQFSFGIIFTEKTAHYAWTSAVASVANLGLNVLMIPRFGIAGAATSTLISYVLLGTLQQVISLRYYPVPYRYGRHFVLYGISGLIIPFALVFTGGAISTLYVLFKVLLVAAWVILPFALGIFRYSEFLNLWSLYLRKRFSWPAGGGI